MLEHFNKLQDKYAHLKDVVGYLKGSLSVGDKLPSERELELILGYTRGTLRESLIRLECFEYISIEHGKSKIYLKEL
jgi:DNA-binding FadR family transcriptional regulator